MRPLSYSITAPTILSHRLILLDIEKRLSDLGAVIVGNNSTELKAFLVQDNVHWKKVIDASC